MRHRNIQIRLLGTVFKNKIYSDLVAAYSYILYHKEKIIHTRSFRNVLYLIMF